MYLAREISGRMLKGPYGLSLKRACLTFKQKLKEIKEVGPGGRLNGSSHVHEEVKVTAVVTTQVNIVRV